MSNPDTPRLLPRLLYGAMALFYPFAVWLDQLQSFSVDSWTYQELAHSFSGDTPYQPVLLRSFWSLEHSAAFPPGYPYLLHVLHGVFGESPYVAVWWCVFVALLTPLIAARVARNLGLPGDAGLLAGVALLGFAPYFEEVLAARSIPLAIAAMLGGLNLLLGARSAGRAIAAGALLGFASLVRFDQLPLMLLIFCYTWLRGVAPRWVLWAGLASLAAMSPWMIMSWQFFGRYWASDNSWVALSSVPVNVTQFPAEAPRTLFDAPLEYAMKCLRNLARLGYYALRNGIPAAKHVLVLVLLWAVYSWRERRVSILRRHAGLLFITCVALLPQVLTGYTDVRYLSMLLLVVSMLCIADLYAGRGSPWGISYGALAGAAVSVALLSGAAWSFQQVNTAYDAAAGRRFQQALLAAVARCQEDEPQVRYVFPTIYSTHAARYAAETGGRSSLTPHGFEKLGAQKRREFELALSPMRYVREVPDDRARYSCAELLEPDLH